MTPTPGAFLRVGGLLLAAVIIQLSGLGQIRIFGGHFDLVPLVVAGVAYYAGSVPGAATGFGAGFLLDLLAGQTMGASSLVLCAVGYGVGRLRELRDPAHGLLPIAVGAAAAAGWVLAFGAVSFMLDVGAASVSGLVFREMVVTVILDTLIALPVFGLVRRVIRPVLAVDPLERRRRRQSPRESGPLAGSSQRFAEAPLMYLDGENRRSLTPQLAFRVALIGGIALVAFGVIFFRLWYLQVLSGDQYEAKANDNRVREIKVQAPRGEVVDRDGRVLVDNRTGLAVKVTPGKLPDDKAERLEVYKRLAGVLGSSAGRIDRSVSDQLKALPYSAATVKQDVKPNVVAYLLERQKEFPGVTVERVFLRQYPHKQIGAHLFGTVGEITKEQLKDQRYRGVGLGDRVGQSGIEYQYDRFLRGKNGASRVQVDALGSLKGELSVRRPVQGRQLRLSVDLGVQRVGQQALGGAKGAFAVMNVRNGQMVALGSTPSFDPNLFSKIIRPRDFKRLSSEELGKPLFNRATQGGYPTGSTYKLVTSVAGLEGGIITPDTVQYDGGSITVGGVRFQNAGGVSHGPVALRKALTVSSDVYYYLIGREANGQGDGLLMQRWARRLGIGRPTGIDMPSEAKGFVPTPKWRNQLFKKKLTDRPWSIGDNINLSVGQGDLAANPLQMAVAYAAVANGGRVLRPRLGQRIEDAGGRALQQLESPSGRRVRIKPEYRQAIMEGLRGAASEPGGTSTPVFKGFPIPVAGKTGTAEKGAGRPDQSWYVALAPYPNPKYVVAVTFEAGGFGADTAAPAARRIMAELFGVKGDAKKQVQGGSAQD